MIAGVGIGNKYQGLGNLVDRAVTIGILWSI